MVVACEDIQMLSRAHGPSRTPGYSAPLSANPAPLLTLSEAYFILTDGSELFQSSSVRGLTWRRVGLVPWQWKGALEYIGDQNERK